MYTRTVPSVTPASDVRKVMTWPVATIDAGATVNEVAEALASDEIGAVCVTEDDRLAGIVSERDVVAHVATGADLTHLTANDVMSNDLVNVSATDSVLIAARRMEEAQVRHLPVLDDGKIAGIVSIRDLFAVLLGAHDESADAVRSDTQVSAAGD